MRIAWEEQGKGAPLLLIQGLGYGRWSWEPIVPALAERYRVLRFDNRGIGESDKPEGPYTAKLMAGDALQVLDEAGVEALKPVYAEHGLLIEAATRLTQDDALAIASTWGRRLLHARPRPVMLVSGVRTG